jgi:hypothetical protein
MAERNGFASFSANDSGVSGEQDMDPFAEGEQIAACPGCGGRRVKLVPLARGLVTTPAGESDELVAEPDVRALYAASGVVSPESVA